MLEIQLLYIKDTWKHCLKWFLKRNCGGWVQGKQLILRVYEAISQLLAGAVGPGLFWRCKSSGEPGWLSPGRAGVCGAAAGAARGGGHTLGAAGLASSPGPPAGGVILALLCALISTAAFLPTDHEQALMVKHLIYQIFEIIFSFTHPLSLWDCCSSQSLAILTYFHASTKGDFPIKWPSFNYLEF